MLMLRKTGLFFGAEELLYQTAQEWTMPDA